MQRGVEAILIRGRRRLRMYRVLTGRGASGLAKSQIFANENLRSFCNVAQSGQFYDRLVQ